MPAIDNDATLNRVEVAAHIMALAAVRAARTKARADAVPLAPEKVTPGTAAFRVLTAFSEIRGTPNAERIALHLAMDFQDALVTLEQLRRSGLVGEDWPRRPTRAGDDHLASFQTAPA